MALIVDRSPYDDMDDDAVQVVDLDDIVVSTITTSEDELLPAVRERRRRRLGFRGIAHLVLAFLFGLALSVPIAAVVRSLQPNDDRSDVDIQDGRRELPADLEPPTRADDPPVPDVTTPPTTAASTPAVDTDPGGKDAFKAAAPTGPPGTAPTGPTTTAPPATTSTAPPTTASPTTTTPSVTLPDGSPNPLGPGPLGPQTGPTTTPPDPFGDDVIPGG